MSMGDKRIADRIAGRKHAEEVLEMRDMRSKSVAFIVAFWRAVTQTAAEQIRAAVPHDPGELVPMTDEEAAAFERKHIEFGQYVNRRHGEVPIDYLTWLGEQSIPLRKYLRSERAIKRQEQANDPENCR